MKFQVEFLVMLAANPAFSWMTSLAPLHAFKSGCKSCGTNVTTLRPDMVGRELLSRVAQTDSFKSELERVAKQLGFDDIQIYDRSTLVARYPQT